MTADGICIIIVVWGALTSIALRWWAGLFANARRDRFPEDNWLIRIERRKLR